MAVTVTLSSAITSLLPPEISSIAGASPTATDVVSLLPTLRNELTSKLRSPGPGGEFLTVTTIQTIRPIQVFQPTIVASTVIQPVTVFITETARETVQQRVELPVPTQSSPPDVTPTSPETLLASTDGTVATRPPDESLPTAQRGNTPPTAEPIIESPQVSGDEPATEAPVKDPATAQFFGGIPTKTVDIPITAIFLVLFAIGAFLHISIYRRNAARGHKFLLSDLMFDFCMIRVVTCIFRITWSIVSTRGVILVALITLNGGAVVIMAINIFFTQRIVRSMHPLIGWHPAFSKGTLFLILTVPAIIVLNIVVLSVSFFSVGNTERLEMIDTGLKFGSSWIVWLSVVPLVILAPSLSTPGPPPEPFGIGPLRIKAAMVIGSAIFMAIGASFRLYTLANPLKPGESYIAFTKEAFYLTGFTLEIIVVFVYAFARVDLLFHVPNGSSGPGDYSQKSKLEKKTFTPEEIEKLIDGIGVPYQITSQGGGDNGPRFVQALFFGLVDSHEPNASFDANFVPPRPERVTRRRTVIEAVNRLSTYVDREEERR